MTHIGSSAQHLVHDKRSVSRAYHYYRWAVVLWAGIRVSLPPHQGLALLLAGASPATEVPGSALQESLFSKKNSIFTGKSQNKLSPSPAVGSKLHQEHSSPLGKAAEESRPWGEEERLKSQNQMQAPTDPKATTLLCLPPALAVPAQTSQPTLQGLSFLVCKIMVALRNEIKHLAHTGSLINGNIDYTSQLSLK